MRVEDAQREVRTVYLGGFPGGVVAGLLWLLSAVVATSGSRSEAIAVLVYGGFLIFPLTMLLLKLMGRRATLSRENPLGGLAMQIAFTIPLSLPLIAAATMHRTEWFYPAFMVVVGAHYLPFVFLYGMRSFAVLAAVLVSGGLAIASVWKGPFALGGWFGGLVLLGFGVLGYALTSREQRLASSRNPAATPAESGRPAAF